MTADLDISTLGRKRDGTTECLFLHMTRVLVPDKLFDGRRDLVRKGSFSLKVKEKVKIKPGDDEAGFSSGTSGDETTSVSGCVWGNTAVIQQRRSPVFFFIGKDTKTFSRSNKHPICLTVKRTAASMGSVCRGEGAACRLRPVTPSLFLGFLPLFIFHATEADRSSGVPVAWLSPCWAFQLKKDRPDPG